MTLPFGTPQPVRVSVIVPAYNAAHTLPAALQSVFVQTYDDFEVIVVDDGSTDGTREAAARWDDRIRYIRQPNGGPASARNTGIAHARGALLAFLDADDVWLPEKLARQVEYFDHFPETGLLHTAAFVNDGTEVPAVPERLHHYPPSPPARQFCEIFETSVEINTLTVMVSREALDAVGVFDERREVHVEDWDLWLRIAARFPVGFLRCPLAIRRPGGAMSAAADKTFAGQQLVLRKAAPLYHAQCSVASRDDGRVNRPFARCAAELAYSRFERGDMAGARRAWREALRYERWPLRTRAYYLASYASPLVDAVRRLKRSRTSAGSKPVRIVPPTATAARTRKARRLPFAQDTVYRRTRQRLADRVHDVDDFIVGLRGGPRRILFEAASPLSFVIFKSIYLRLARDPRIEFCFTSTTRSWPAEAIFRSVGITGGVIKPSDAAWMRFDACINTDFYEMTWLHRRTVRLQLFHGVAGKYGIDAPVDVAPDIAEFDRILFPNVDRLRSYLQAGLIDEKAALLVGYPKVDCLVDGSLNRRAIADGLGLRADVPTILYAPTWSPDSSLHLMGDAVIRALVDTGFNVLVKLHDRSYDLTRRASGGIDWMSRLSEYDGHERVRVVREADACPYLMVADALVTDHSSIGFEYSLLDRPIVVLDAPALAKRARINPRKVAMLRAAAEVIQSPDDLKDAIVSQLVDSRAHALARRRLAAEMFYQPGSATDRATAVVYDAIGLEPQPMPTVAAEPYELSAAVAPGRKAS